MFYSASLEAAAVFQTVSSVASETVTEVCENSERGDTGCVGDEKENIYSEESNKPSFVLKKGQKCALLKIQALKVAKNIGFI
ncbi:hypothetical protein HUJ05_004016 [Dendroctonus ponderosae]|nr:hypothetical protein HUJ05_004016 [Dendroctonus ponderosae]